MLTNSDVRRTRPALLALLALLAGALWTVGPVYAGDGLPPGGANPTGEHTVVALSAASDVYLPLVIQPSSSPAPTPQPGPTPTPIPQPNPALPANRQVNAPYFNTADITAERFTEMAVFWFGQVDSEQNYVDVRLGYNDNEITVYLAVFDRRLWYDPSPSLADLHNWDGATLYLNPTGNTGDNLTPDAYRFDAQINWFENPRDAYQASYRGQNGAWEATDLEFSTVSGWRGDNFNNSIDDRGWVVTFNIPFASLGLSSKPEDAANWGLALALHDRDAAESNPLPDLYWPEASVLTAPETWGKLHFGLPGYAPATTTAAGEVIIRHKLNGAVVPDAAVGGTTGNLCPGDSDYIWNEWGNDNFGDSADLNIQNQSDIADWPCFSKYYVSFPLDQVPAGKVIVSASLILHQWGNSGPYDLVTPSFIQVFSIQESWSAQTITWNNAPLAYENVSQAWVPKVDCSGGSGLLWPCTPRVWDVSRAAAAAYAAGAPLQLALYSSDSDYHSGKLFTTSDTGDWNAEGRPTLVIEWGNP